MAKHTPPTLYPAPIAPGRFGMSGRVPNPQSWRRIASGFNFAAARLRKQVFQFCYGNNGTAQAPPDIDGGGADVLHWVFRSGLAVEAIEVVVAVARHATQTANAHGYVALTDGTNTCQSDDFSIVRPDSGAWGPSDIAWHVFRVPGVPDDTVLRGSLFLFANAAIQSIAAYEVAGAVLDDADVGVCDPTPFAVHADVEAAAIEQVVTAGAALWRKGGAQLLSWAQSYEGAGVLHGADVADTDGLGNRNILDESTSTSANDAGFYVDTTLLKSRMRDLGIEIGIYARLWSGTADLNVSIVGDSGTVASFTVPAASVDAQGFILHTVQTTITAADDKWRIYADAGSDASGDEWLVLAVGAWLYEA